MAVKKVTSAAKQSARPKKALPTKAVLTTASATKMTAAKATTKARATKVTTTKATTKASASKVPTTKKTAKAPTKAPTKAPSKAATKTPSKAATKAPSKSTVGPRGRGASVPASASAQPQRLRVRENEKPWTVKELATVRAELDADIARLQKEISLAELDLAGLMRDIGDGAGDDPADAGTATFEREQEISLANNAREVFAQSARALARLVDGSYGICESCGSPIGKNRLLAFPRATLCLTCKSKQERR
ncbi:MAG TPA: TraR/DksA C4-type zinc finger protein [Dermatophilaceae bacterium]|nr:TraR/DksA C4-type zinc finger protein [Dermatophilaceae bacterium]